jgi:predicted DNA-binding WGR domain protein
MSGATRHFELHDGGAGKFCDVTLEDASFTLGFGLIGSAGHTRTVQSANAEAAAILVSRVVRDRLRRGYVETNVEAAPFSRPTHLDSFRHPTRWFDHEVVSFDPEAQPHERAGERRLITRLTDLAHLAPEVGIRWDEPRALFAARLDALLADPKLAELEALVLGNWFGSVCDVPPKLAYEKLIEHAPHMPQLRGLFVGDVTQDEAELSWLSQCDAAPVIESFAGLTHFVVRGGEDLRFIDLRHDNLLSLTVQTGGMSRQCLHDILSADLPALTRLTLWLGVPQNGATFSLDDLTPLFEGGIFPRLEHLGLQNCEETDELARRAAGSLLVSRLKGLDLSMGTLSDVGAAALLESASVRTLKHLNLRHHFMSVPVTATMRGLPMDVNVADRLDEDEERRAEAID